MIKTQRFMLALLCLFFSSAFSIGQVDCNCYEGINRNIHGNTISDYKYGAHQNLTSQQFIKTNHDIEIAAAESITIGFPFQIETGGTLSAYIQECNSLNDSTQVIIVGAGAAGLTAAYLLDQLGIDYKIFEASSTYGGRMKKTESFTTFPIPLGAEWIHTNESILNEIVNNDGIQHSTSTVGYNSNDPYGYVNNGNYSVDVLGQYDDKKFVNSSWLNFFEDQIVPKVSDHITYNSVVSNIDYSNQNVIVSTSGGQSYSADKVIVTVPLKILQSNVLTFTPSLPTYKQNAINNSQMWDGLKVFIKFNSKFYPTFVEYNVSGGEKLFFDAAYGQNTSDHVLGFFSVGTPAQSYVSLTDTQIKDQLLSELDAIFNNQASAGFVDFVVQNWTNETYAQGAYVRDNESYSRVSNMGDSVSNKVFFAGEGYTDGNDWGSVHNAVRSARTAVEEIIANLK